MVKRLKKCPRCGGAADYGKRYSGITKDGERVFMFDAHCEYHCMTSPEFETCDEAAEWWNVRPTRGAK